MSTTVNKTPQKETHKEQEKRVEMARKLEAAKEGKLPDNQDLTSGLNKAQAGITRNNDQLSATGQTVTGDITNILETAKTIVNEKNQGNLMQKAYYHSNQAGQKKSLSERINQLRGTSMGSGDKTAVRTEAKQNVNSMATIVKLAFLSPEFRETINDAAQIASQLLKSREDKHAAKAGGVPTSTTSTTATTTPVAAPAPVPVETTRAVPATGTVPSTGLATGAPVMDAPVLSPVTATPDFVVPGTAAPKPTATIGGNGPFSGTAAGVPATGAATSAIPATGTVPTTGAVPMTSTTSTTRGVPAAGVNTTGRKLTREEKEDKLISRMIDLAQTLHKNPEYRNSILYMANSAEKLKGHAKVRKDEAKAVREQDKAREPRSEIEHHKKEAQLNSKEFVENWIGDDYTLDRLLNQLQFLYQSSKTDPELRSLLHDWKTWSTATVKDESYIQDKERVHRDTKDLIQRTRMLSQGKYRDEVAILRREIIYINKALQRDDSIQALRTDFNQLGRDILMDQNGKPVLKPELLGDAQKIIMGVLESIKYIPLPPIHKNDETMELQLENIVLTATEVAPSNVRFIVQADGEKTGADASRQNDNSFIIELSKIRAHLTSINFFVDKKTGFPKITERGLADIDLMGTNGLSLRIEVAPKMQKTGKNVHSVFEAKNVTCTIDKLKIHLRETKHDFLYKLVGPIINAVAKKKIQTGVADAIRDGIAKLNDSAATGATNTAVKADQKAKQSDKVRTN